MWPTWLAGLVVASAQFTLEELATWIVGMRVGEYNALGALDAGHVLAAVRHYRAFAKRLVGLEHNHGGVGLHLARIGQPDHRHIADLGANGRSFLRLRGYGQAFHPHDP